MSDPAPAPEIPAKLSQFSFFKAGVDVLAITTDGVFDWVKAATETRDQISEAVNARNVSFLLGSGCSSKIENKVELGIPTMRPLAAEFATTIGTRGQTMYANLSERKLLKDGIGLDIADLVYADNLERLMETLFCCRLVLNQSSQPRHKRTLRAAESVIKKIQRFVLDRCSDGKFARGDKSVVELYQIFYRKLVFRDRALPRPWVFTTNYDLFNETAMDRLGLPYCNGFSGTIERRFNPATFRYALAEQLDIANRKWTAVDGFVYLCKLHGSINWTEDEEGLFRIRETASFGEHDRIMIYPTPAKQNSSLGTPYSDLFREFQAKIVREQSVLFCIGYSFGDEHINNIIYQALTIPTFKLIIFADPNEGKEVAKLRALSDPRIWIIGGAGREANRSAHFFDSFVEEFMPQLPSEKIQEAVAQVLSNLLRPQSELPKT